MKVKSKNELGQAEKRHGDDKMLVVRKSAGFLTICRELHDELSTVCDKSHSQGSFVNTTPKKSQNTVKNICEKEPREKSWMNYYSMTTMRTAYEVKSQKSESTYKWATQHDTDAKNNIHICVTPHDAHSTENID